MYIVYVFSPEFQPELSTREKRVLFEVAAGEPG